jgi:hypothetical protein
MPIDSAAIIIIIFFFFFMDQAMLDLFRTLEEYCDGIIRCFKTDC